MEQAWTVNHAVGRSNPSCVTVTKSLQQASNPKTAESFGSRPKLGGHLCPSPIVQVLRLTGAVSSDVLHFVSLWITLTVSEVGGTDNGVTFKLPLLLDHTYSTVYIFGPSRILIATMYQFL